MMAKYTFDHPPGLLPFDRLRAGSAPTFSGAVNQKAVINVILN
jgi:hypothetical protein